MLPRHRPASSVRRTLGVLLAAAVLPGAAHAASYEWTASTTDTAWSTASNWAGGVAPSAGESIDSLTFPRRLEPVCRHAPYPAGCLLATNDVPGLHVKTLRVADSYTLGDTGIGLGSGGLQVAFPLASAGFGSIDLPLTLESPQSWSIAAPAGTTPHAASLSISSPLAGDHALTITLANGADLGFSDGHNEVGPLTIVGADPSRGNVDANGGLLLFQSGEDPPTLNGDSGGPVTVTRAALQATGSIGALTADHAAIRIGEGGTDHIVRTPRATFGPGTGTTFFLYGTGTVAGSDHSALVATGPVALGGTPSVVNLTGGCAVAGVGSVLTLLSTTGELTGSYDGLADGAVISITPSAGCPAQARKLRLNYRRTGVIRAVTATVVSGDTLPTTPLPTTPKPTTPLPTTPKPTTPAPTTPAPTTPPALTTPAETTPTEITPDPPPPAPPVFTAEQIPSPSPSPVPLPTTPLATTPTLAARPALLSRGRLVLAKLPIAPLKRGVCPKTATLVISVGGRRVIKRVKLARAGKRCQLTTTLRLPSPLAKAKSVRVTVSGKGIRTSGWIARSG